MTQETKNVLARAIGMLKDPNITLEEAIVLLENHLKENSEVYTIASLSKTDLEIAGFYSGYADTSIMSTIADKMNDDYKEQLFHVQLPIIAEGCGVLDYSDLLDSMTETLEHHEDMTGRDTGEAITELQEVFTYFINGQDGRPDISEIKAKVDKLEEGFSHLFGPLIWKGIRTQIDCN